MPTSTAWSRPTTDGALHAARAALSAVLPAAAGPDLDAAADHAELVAIAAGPSHAREAAVVALASEVLAAMHDALPLPAGVLEDVAAEAALEAEPFALAVAETTFSHPRIAALAPPLALTAVLELLALTAPIGHASVWQRNNGELRCLAHAGCGCPSRSVRDAGRRALLSPRVTRRQGLLQVVAVPGRDDAVIVARPCPGERERCQAFLRLAAAALGPVLARLAAVERDAPSGELLAAASERRLARIGFDLHDGPAQSLAALIGESRLLQAQLAELGDDETMTRVAGRVGDLTTRAVALEFELRSLCQSLESPTVMCRPIERVIEQEMLTFQRKTGVRPRVELGGRFDELSESQRIAIVRIVQEALRNVHEHARARNVALVLQARARGTEAIVFDDGRGFDVDSALARAVRDGRIGLIGMMERVRLLGGSCTVRSRRGGPTTIAVSLPRWEQAAA